MTVELRSPLPAVVRGASPPAPARDAATPTDRPRHGTVPTGDAVSLTASARAVLDARATLHAVPEVDSARVEQVRAALDAGQYQVDARRVAAGFLRLEALLPGTR